MQGEFGEPKDARKERPDNVHGLEPVQAHVASSAENDARVQLDVIGADSKLVKPPRDRIQVGGYQQDGDHQRSEEHTSELQSRGHLVCRHLPEKKNVTEQIPKHL